MMEDKKPLVLVYGSTGKTGVHISNLLVAEGFPVRIFCRSKEKVTKVFEEKQIGFEKIVEGSLEKEEDMKKAFDISESYGPVGIVVSALGKGPGSGPSIQQIQYLTQVKIIELCKQYKVQKYVFVTAALIERPWHPIAVLLNSLFPEVMHWKMMAENYLRKSGLNYIIIRPPGLLGDQKNTKLTDYRLDQGDKVSRSITRFTVGKITVQAILSKQIPSKVTFECESWKNPKPEQKDFGILKPDTEASIVKKNHYYPKFIYFIGFLSLIVGVGTYFFSEQKNL